MQTMTLKRSVHAAFGRIPYRRQLPAPYDGDLRQLGKPSRSVGEDLVALVAREQVNREAAKTRWSEKGRGASVQRGSKRWEERWKSRGAGLER